MLSNPRSRPPTPARSSPRDDESVPAMPDVPKAPPAPRRTSFGFLRRSKSGETVSRRSTSGSKLSKRQQQNAQTPQELLRRQQAEGTTASIKTPPVLPDVRSPPPIHSFGGEDARPDSVDIVSNKYPRGLMDPFPPTAPPSIPIPPIPGNASKGRHGNGIDSVARGESMTHRGRYSYASSMVSTINSPRRVRRRKDPTPFNVLVIGAQNSGKTSFLNFLRTSLALPQKGRGGHIRDEVNRHLYPNQASTGDAIYPTFTSQYLETEMEGERVGLTLWDSQGLDKSMVDLQLREMVSFVESKFEETFMEEMKVVRAPGVQDTHIHCVFLVLDPARLDSNIANARRIMERESRRNASAVNGKVTLPGMVGGLDEGLDLQVLRALQGKTTVVPVISKADTVTTTRMAYLKKTVWDSLKMARIDLLESLGVEEGDVEDGADGASNNVGRAVADDGVDDDYSSGSIIIQQNNAVPEEHMPGGFPTTTDMSENTHKGRETYFTTPLTPNNIQSNNHPPPSSSSSSSPNTGTGGLATAPFLPLSILSPDTPSMNDTEEQQEEENGVQHRIGRRFPWGFADPYDPNHCDFLRLKDVVFKEWRGDLKEVCKEVWYEQWRTSRLRRK